jgi:hypothetical protein
MLRRDSEPPENDELPSFKWQDRIGRHGAVEFPLIFLLPKP